MICPSCGSEMVIRTAKQGPFKGKQFYGCSSFPRCRKIVNIDQEIFQGELLKSKEAESNFDTIDEETSIPVSDLKLKPRHRHMYLKDTDNTPMKRYSGNYSYTNHNFVIQNIFAPVNKTGKYFDAICILKNILLRGSPTIMSRYLQEHLGPIHRHDQFEESIPLISDGIPNWNHCPNIDFLTEVIAEYLPDHLYLQQLFFPGAPISEICQSSNDMFQGCNIDFYLPQARLAIQIDQLQDRNNGLNRDDSDQDNYLRSQGIETIRINAKDIIDKSYILGEKVIEIKERLKLYSHNLKDYEGAYERINNSKGTYIYDCLRATAVARFQILILSLLEVGKLDLSRKEWKLGIGSWESLDNFAELALEDLFLWMENICKLLKLEFNKPELIIKKYHPEEGNAFVQLGRGGYINIDFSILKRWTDENQLKPNTIYLRTDYFDQYNYFKISTSQPINYSLNIGGHDSDLSALEFLLKNIFGHDGFNPGQLSSIINSLEGHDTIAILPTGGGKSLIYQFTGFLQPTVNFIVSPIISLMKDQRDNLDNLYISNTQYISSSQSPKEKANVQIEYGQGKYQFVWITPERFQTSGFRRELEIIDERFIIGMAVIDEVHCLSEWGHDFRTSYLNLAKTIDKYCHYTRILGLTATASVNVLKDILVEFDIDKSNVKTIPSFTRPELTFKIIRDWGYSVDDKKNTLNGVLESLIKKQSVFNIDGKKTKCGIIFTRTVGGSVGCYSLARYINNEFAEYEPNAHWYSGSQPKKVNFSSNEFMRYKEKVQEDFKGNKFPILVATKAFGMGIDKENIRYTIHYGIPGSLEALYQEAGRAGRDKKPAICFILLSRENIGSNYLNTLFDLNTTVDSIANIQKQVKYEGRDVFRNIFFWLNQTRDPYEEMDDIYGVYKKYAKPEGEALIECREIGLTKDILEKVIYKLSLIGVVEDWVIEDWGFYNGAIRVFFSFYSEESIIDALLFHIKKYDPSFDFTRPIPNSPHSHYIEYYNRTDRTLVEKVIYILLKWHYENIAYFRRESIKTIYDQCMKNQGEEEFKRYMESYFKFGETAFSFDYIAENPDEYEHWFDTFYQNQFELLSIDGLKERRASLRRFIESFRFNVGLNYIDGMLNLLIGEEGDDASIERLRFAFEAIKRYHPNAREEILNNTLNLSKTIELEKKEIISEILNGSYPSREYDIYMALKDNYSLYFLMNKSIDKIREGVGGLL